MQLRIKDIADNANMIINGYAYTKDGDYIRVLNLNCLNNATIFPIAGTETTYCKTSINGMEIYGCLNCKRKRRCYYLE